MMFDAFVSARAGTHVFGEGFQAATPAGTSPAQASKAIVNGIGHFKNILDPRLA
jgi:hypothetical protein